MQYNIYIRKDNWEKFKGEEKKSELINVLLAAYYEPQYYGKSIIDTDDKINELMDRVNIPLPAYGPDVTAVKDKDGNFKLGKLCPHKNVNKRSRMCEDCGEYLG